MVLFLYWTRLFDECCNVLQVDELRRQLARADQDRNKLHSMVEQQQSDMDAQNSRRAGQDAALHASLPQRNLGTAD